MAKPTREEEKRKRVRELVVAVIGICLIALIMFAERKMVGATEEIGVSGHLLLFGLLSMVTLLLILVVFFLMRNLFKLVFERRGRILKTNLKIRLIAALTALTVAPSILLFMAGAGVVHTTIESWFTAQVENALQSALVVSQAYYKGASENALHTAERIALTLEVRDLLNPAGESELRTFLRERPTAKGPGSVRIHFLDERAPVVVNEEGLEPGMLPEPRESLLKIAYQGHGTVGITPLDNGGDLIRAVVPVKGPGHLVSAVVVDQYIPNSLAGRLSSVSNAFGDYQEAKRMKGPIKLIYVLILLLVALLVIFIGFWFGMSLAREITDPIQTLSEGADRIAAGDLDVFIDPVRDDELGDLTVAFNRMTEDLRKSRDELLKANQNLESRRRYMEVVLGNIAAGVLALDPDQRVTAVNASARRLLGIAQEDATHKTLEEILPEGVAASVTAILEELHASGLESLERQITTCPGDQTLSLICFADSLRDEDGRDLGVALVFEDMTYLIKGQRMAAWRDVARRIAHEIKNPLTPIQLNAQRIRRKYWDSPGRDNEVLDQCTSSIVQQVEQLKHMVNEFSKFARMPAANLVPSDLNATVKGVVELYSQGVEGIDFTFTADPRVPIMDLDPEQMQRVAVNLLDNAVAAIGHAHDGAMDASSESRAKRGKVTVTTGFDPVLSIASIEVTDNGPGLQPGDRERLFEPYFSTKPGGAGLGLTIVSAIVSDHNGFIRAKDAPGGGARFVIEIPVRRSSLAGLIGKPSRRRSPMSSTNPVRSESSIEAGSRFITSGGLVIAATETFYCIAADPTREHALRRIFELKGRSETKPLALIAADPDAVRRWAILDDPLAVALAEKFWPGSLTLLLPPRGTLSTLLLGADGLVGIRISPPCPARSLAELTGGCVTATSANISAGPEHRDVSTIPERLRVGVDAVIDTGPTPGGRPSTVCSAAAGRLRIHREGAVPSDMVRAFVDSLDL
jgi:two-component system nitrogen regulation sensor histidine kinase NtrY